MVGVILSRVIIKATKKNKIILLLLVMYRPDNFLFIRIISPIKINKVLLKKH